MHYAYFCKERVDKEVKESTKELIPHQNRCEQVPKYKGTLRTKLLKSDRTANNGRYLYNGVDTAKYQ